MIGALAALAGVTFVARATRSAFTVLGVTLVGAGVAVMIACAGRPWLAAAFAVSALGVTAVFAFIAHLLLPRGHTADALPLATDPTDAEREGIGDAELARAARPQPRLSAAITIAIFVCWGAVTVFALARSTPIEPATGTSAAAAPTGSWILPTLAVVGLAGTLVSALAFLFDRPTDTERAAPDEGAAADAETPS